MAGRRFFVISIIVLAIGSSLFRTGAASERDKKVLPPSFRSFASPDGSFVLEIQGPPGWKSPYATADLFSAGRSGRHRLWSQTLPQRFGPGTALVADSGRVVLLNEGANTPSPRSIAVLSETGAEIAHYSLEEIAAVARVPVSEMIRAAGSGVWMSAPVAPVWNDGIIMFEARGVRLALNLSTGQLGLVPR